MVKAKRFDATYLVLGQKIDNRIKNGGFPIPISDLAAELKVEETVIIPLLKVHYRGVFSIGQKQIVAFGDGYDSVEYTDYLKIMERTVESTLKTKEG